MTNKEITQKSLKQVKDLLSDVQAMTGKEFMKILDSMAQFHEYSFSNQLILCFHGCSQVAGYKKWQELERRVKKGAKAVWILAPYLRKEKVKVKNGEGTEGEKEEKYVMPDLIGKHADRVTAYLKKKGFRVSDLRESFYPGIESGIIINQLFPKPGYPVQKRTLITLEVSK